MKKLEPTPNYKEAYLYLVKWIRGLPFDIDQSDREKLQQLGMDYPKKYNQINEKTTNKNILRSLFGLD